MSRFSYLRAFAALAFLAVLAGASAWFVLSFPRASRDAVSATPPADRPLIALALNGTRIVAEIVSTPEEIRQGLSDRPSIPRDRGMLFELGFRDEHVFWMNRMHFPLDIIWIDGDRVVEIAEALPPPRTGAIPYSHVPKAYADRVLEVNAGVVKEAGLRVGDKIGGLTEE